MAVKHIVIYSHGFGVRKDDRGLFTDIAAALPSYKHVMFDYGVFNEAENTLTIPSLYDQANTLKQKIAEVRAQNPDAIIDLICHSQGCIVAALAKPEGIRKFIFTGPPAILNVDRMLDLFANRPGSEVNLNGISHLKRADFSTTDVLPEYWKSLENINPTDLYNYIAKIAPTALINATKDEILGSLDFTGISPNIKVIEIETGHNFEGEGRQKLIDAIKSELELAQPRVTVVNDQDEVVGLKERSTLAQEDIYRVSALWVTNPDGDILLAQRHHTKKHHPNLWGPAVAGTIDEGETYDENIVKEAEEEIGLKDILLKTSQKIRITGEHNHFTQWYTLVCDKPAEDFVIQEDEVEQVKWFTREELASELRECPEKYLRGMKWNLDNL